jgi:hypothetical protein
LRTKFDIINKKYDISKFFTTFRKCFPPKFSRKTVSWKPSQIFLWLKSVFYWPTFLIVNKHRKVWKVISWKSLFEKQTSSMLGFFSRTYWLLIKPTRLGFGYPLDIPTRPPKLWYNIKHKNKDIAKPNKNIKSDAGQQTKELKPGKERSFRRRRKPKEEKRGE